MVTPLGDWDDPSIDFYKRAIRALGRERFDAAADRYTLAAYGAAAGHERFRRHAFDPEEPGWAGDALQFLVLAGVCERIVGRDGRAANRTAQGALVAQDQRSYVLDHPVRRASCYEFEGDLHTVGKRTSKAETAYERALELYEGYEPVPDEPAPQRWTTEQPLQAGTDLLAQLTRPDRITWDDLHGADPERALVRRVEVRRARMPAVVQGLVDDGKLHAPRGSTEFNTGRFECPHCGSDAVNFVADTELCVRCSAPTEAL
jgi:hypothetical protein